MSRITQSATRRSTVAERKTAVENRIDAELAGFPARVRNQVKAEQTAKFDRDPPNPPKVVEIQPNRDKEWQIITVNDRGVAVQRRVLVSTRPKPVDPEEQV